MTTQDRNVYPALVAVITRREDPTAKHFVVYWDDEEQEHRATCAGYASLSYCDPDPTLALVGLLQVMQRAEQEAQERADGLREGGS